MVMAMTIHNEAPYHNNKGRNYVIFGGSKIGIQVYCLCLN